MLKTNVLEIINLNEVANFILKPNNNNDPCISVEMVNGDLIQMTLTTGFEIHCCNEFLRSLKVIPDDRIAFKHYEGYDRTITYCNRLFEIRKIMEAVTGKEYSQINVIACDVHSCILDKLSSKYKRNMLQEAYQTNTLDRYVAEAITYLMLKHGLSIISLGEEI